MLDQDPERRIEVVRAREVALVRSMTLAASERTALARDDPPQDTARVLERTLGSHVVECRRRVRDEVPSYADGCVHRGFADWSTEPVGDVRRQVNQAGDADGRAI